MSTDDALAHLWDKLLLANLRLPSGGYVPAVEYLAGAERVGLYFRCGVLVFVRHAQPKPRTPTALTGGA